MTKILLLFLGQDRTFGVELLAFFDRFGDQVQDDLDRLDCIVVRRNGISNALRINVSVADRDDRHFGVDGFGKRRRFGLKIEKKNSFRQFAQVGEAAHLNIQVLGLFYEFELFLFRVLAKLTAFDLAFEVKVRREQVVLDHAEVR